VGAILRNTGLGFAPLVRGILSIFGGGEDEPEPAALVKYSAPEAAHVEQTLWKGSLVAADRDQSGAIRPTVVSRLTSPAAADRPPLEESGRRPAADGAGQQTVVNVNVQAIDSRSFLDYSHEIARAVREAMLTMNPINDVVSDL
jgi:hypothetical protein